MRPTLLHAHHVFRRARGTRHAHGVRGFRPRSRTRITTPRDGYHGVVGLRSRVHHQHRRRAVAGTPRLAHGSVGTWRAPRTRQSDGPRQAFCLHLGRGCRTSVHHGRRAAPWCRRIHGTPRIPDRRICRYLYFVGCALRASSQRRLHERYPYRPMHHPAPSRTRPFRLHLRHSAARATGR